MTKHALTVTLPTVILVAAIAGAAGFAIGSATTTAPATASTSPPPPAPMEAHSSTGGLAAEDPMMGDLPVGHPAVTGTSMGDPSAAESESTLVWTPPARWQKAPNTSAMRLATYKIPHAPGDAEDPEMSVTQVGGSVDANIDRWIGQFDEAGQKTAKRSRRTVGGLEVSIVQIEGTYSGGMDTSGARPNWALLGAIVATPGMPHFFKMTGPSKSVAAARAELDAMLGTLKNGS